jgi:branched-chain amino acid transport system permease protein
VRVLRILAILVVFSLVPFAATATGADFLIGTFTRILIFAMAAVSLDFIVGSAGLVSFGHAAFFGIGGYVVAILSQNLANGAGFGNEYALIVWPLAALIAGLVALVIGALSLRSEGVFFIMITLAFSQMVYFTFLTMPDYGSDDGVNIARRNLLPGFDLADDRTFYYLCLGLLVVVIALCQLFVRSRWGMVLDACRQNEKRSRALGIWPYPYRLAAFTFAGAVAGLAGALMANQTLFMSTRSLDWRLSGDLLVVIILGGMRSVYGPVVGATIYFLLAEFLGVQNLFGPLAEHWQLVFGIFLVLIVLYAPRGIAGWLGRARHD